MLYQEGSCDFHIPTLFWFAPISEEQQARTLLSLWLLMIFLEAATPMLENLAKQRRAIAVEDSLCITFLKWSCFLLSSPTSWPSLALLSDKKGSLRQWVAVIFLLGGEKYRLICEANLELHLLIWL